MTKPGALDRSALNQGDEREPAERRFPWKATLGGALSSALCLWLVTRSVDLEQVRAQLEHTAWGSWWAYLACVVGVQLMRLARWHGQLVLLGERRAWRTASIGAVGMTAIFYLPARLGEIVRPWLIASPSGVEVAEASATIVSERLFDGLLVALMIVSCGLWAALAAPESLELEQLERMTRLSFGVGGAFLALMLATWGTAWRPAWALAVARRLLARTARLQASVVRAVERFSGGLRALSRGPHLLVYLLYSASMWTLNALALLILFEAVGLARLPAIAAFVVLGTTSLGILLPAAPTALGTFHFAVVSSLALFGVPAEEALGMATLFHLAQSGGNVGVGLLGVPGVIASRRGEGGSARGDSPRELP